MFRALPFFSLVLFVPGYLAGMASNALGFRSAKIIERIALALLLSSAISPYLISILCRALSIPVVSAFFLLLGLLFFVNVILEWRRNKFELPGAPHWSTKAIVGLVAVWLFVCLASLPDLQLDHRLYSTAAVYDHGTRSAFISSAIRSGAPPENPFLYAGAPVPSRYYYYWYVLCAIPGEISGATSRVTLFASCFWSGLLIAAAIPVYLKHFLHRTSRLRVSSLIGVGLISVTGLDLLPTAILKFGARNSVPLPDMEWWDPVQVSSWLDAFLWVPHHVASLVSCLAAFLFIWKATDSTTKRQRIFLLSFGAIGFASAAGLSVLVTFAFAAFVIFWIGFLLLHRRFRDAIQYALAGGASVCLSVFYLSDLLGLKTSASGHGDGSPFSLALRKLPYALSDVPSVIGQNSILAVAATHLLLVFIVLFLELGVYFVIGFYRAERDWKRRKTISDADKALWTMALSALFVMLFLRSTFIQGNDLGVRGALLLQFVLLLWTAAFLSGDAPSTEGVGVKQSGMLFRVTLVGLIAVGAAGSLYQLWTLRTFAYFNEKYSWQSSLQGFGQIPTGRKSFQIRDAYAALDRVTDHRSIVQFNPESDLRLYLLQYSRYQAVDAFYPDCAIAFGGTLSDCHRVEPSVKSIFDPNLGYSPSMSDVEGICQRLGIKVLVVTSTDPIWTNAASWMWQARPFVSNDFVRMYYCDARQLSNPAYRVATSQAYLPGAFIARMYWPPKGIRLKYFSHLPNPR